MSQLISPKAGVPAASPSSYLEDALALARAHGGSMRGVDALDDYTFALPSPDAVNGGEDDEA